MSQTTIRQKIFLLGAGVLCALIFLEMILRAGGFIFSWRQDFTNQKALSENHEEFRILCIGESTTALGMDNSYPSQLEEILNHQGINKRFKVINKGLIAKTSVDILAQLESNLNIYKPDLVVSMIGINDPYFVSTLIKKTWLIAADSFLEEFRVYKLFKLLGKHISHKWADLSSIKNRNEDKDFSLTQTSSQNFESMEDFNNQEHNPQEVITKLVQLQLLSNRLEKYLEQPEKARAYQKVEKQLAQIKFKAQWLSVYLERYYRMRGNFSEAQKYLALALMQQPESYTVYLELGRVYKEQKDYKRAIGFFRKAMDFFPKGNLSLLEMARCYSELGEKKEAFRIFETIAQRQPNDVWIFTEVGGWFKENGFYSQAQEVFELAIKMNSLEYSLYEQLSQIYLAQGKLEEAKKFHEQFLSGEAELYKYLPSTVYNYNRIADTVLSRGIKLICMQYPLRSIDPLKKLLKSKDKIIFVENKSNFENALKEWEYGNYFSDSFAGDFGHCTRAGNRLIAENVVNVIINEILSK